MTRVAGRGQDAAAAVLARARVLVLQELALLVRERLRGEPHPPRDYSWHASPISAWKLELLRLVVRMYMNVPDLVGLGMTAFLGQCLLEAS